MKPFILPFIFLLGMAALNQGKAQCTKASFQTNGTTFDINESIKFTSTSKPITSTTEFRWIMNQKIVSTDSFYMFTSMETKFHHVCLEIYDSTTNCLESNCDSVEVVKKNAVCEFKLNVENTTDSCSKSLRIEFLKTPKVDSIVWEFTDNSRSFTNTSIQIKHTSEGTNTYEATATVYSGSCSSSKSVIMLTPECSKNNCATPVSFSSNGRIFDFNQQIKLENTSQPINSTTKFRWTMDQKTVSTDSDFQFSSITNKFHHVCLEVYDLELDCQDTFCDSFEVINKDEACEFTLVTDNTLDSCAKNFRIEFLNSPKVDSVLWEFTDGSPSITNTATQIQHTSPYTEAYQTTATVFSGNCTSSMTTNVYTLGCKDTNNLSISLFLSYPNDIIFSLYQKKKDKLVLVDTFYNKSFSYASFDSLRRGKYLVKAAVHPESHDYYKYIPTYYSHSSRWDSATILNLTGPIIKMFSLIQANSAIGSGSLGGHVIEGNNKDEDLPFANAQIIVLDVNMNPVAHTRSNKNGEFQFNSLAYGKYYIYGEVSGLKSTASWVTISEETPQIKNVVLKVYSNVITTRINNIENQIANIIELYPNPTSDKLNIRVGQHKGVLNITDLSGKTLITKNIDQVILLDLQHLEAGSYILSFTTKEGQISYKQILKK